MGLPQVLPSTHVHKMCRLPPISAQIVVTRAPRKLINPLAPPYSPHPFPSSELLPAPSSTVPSDAIRASHTVRREAYETRVDSSRSGDSKDVRVFFLRPLRAEIRSSEVSPSSPQNLLQNSSKGLCSTWSPSSIISYVVPRWCHDGVLPRRASLQQTPTTTSARVAHLRRIAYLIKYVLEMTLYICGTFQGESPPLIMKIHACTTAPSTPPNE